MIIKNSYTYILIDRKNLFNDAYHKIMNLLPYSLKKKIRIKYIGEEGIDSGDLLR